MRSVFHGRTNFEGRRLNFLQIGLGTCRTFFQNLARCQEYANEVEWLLAAVSDRSTTLLGVGVEPVPACASGLLDTLLKLPNATIVQAAIGLSDGDVVMHTLSLEVYLHCIEHVVPRDKQEDFKWHTEFLMNMSCVDDCLPAFTDYVTWIDNEFHTQLKTDLVTSRMMSYGTLVKELQFSGTEVLMIDAEGHDCKILKSMIDHCTREENVNCWPTIISVETMGHCNLGDGTDTEYDVLQTLCKYGYMIAYISINTQLYREDHQNNEYLVRQWLAEFACSKCFVVGRTGLPFHSVYKIGVLCHTCYTGYEHSAGLEEMPSGCATSSQDILHAPNKNNLLY